MLLSPGQGLPPSRQPQQPPEMKVHLEAKTGCSPGAGSRRRAQPPRLLGGAGVEPQSRARLGPRRARPRGEACFCARPWCRDQRPEHTPASGQAARAAGQGTGGASGGSHGGDWRGLGSGGRPDRSGPGSSAHGVCSCLGGQEARADVPPHGDGTHIPRSSSSQASSQSQWVVPPATRSLEIHPVACGRPSQASWKQWGQEGVCAEPCRWSPRGSLWSPCCCW